MWRRPGTCPIALRPLTLSCPILFLVPCRLNTSSVKTVSSNACREVTPIHCFEVRTLQQRIWLPIRAQKRQGCLTHILCLIATEKARDGTLVL